MILYSYISIDQPLDRTIFYQLLSEVPADMQSRIQRYYRWQDRHNALLGKILLRELLITYFDFSSNCLEKLYKNKYGKLFINKKLDFNISHSGTLVMCVVSDESTVGVDVEQIESFRVEDIKPFLRTEEFEQLVNEPTSDLFYDFWTKKESVLKAKGLGLSLDLKTVYLNQNTGQVNDELWHFQSLEVPVGYKANLCTSKQDSFPELIEADHLLKLSA